MVGKRFSSHVALETPISGRLETIGIGPVQASAIGIGVYTNVSPALTVLLDDGSLFYDIPLADFCLGPGPRHVGNDMTCPSSSGVWVVHPHVSRNVQMFGANRDWLGVGTYIATIEWSDHNLVGHLVCGTNRIHFLKNPRVLWGSNAGKKLPAHPKPSIAPRAALVAWVTQSNKLVAVQKKGQPHTIGFPGGKVEYGEHTITCATREYTEETGFRCPTGVQHLCTMFDGEYETWVYFGSGEGWNDPVTEPEDKLELRLVGPGEMGRPGVYSEFNTEVLRLLRGRGLLCEQ